MKHRVPQKTSVWAVVSRRGKCRLLHRVVLFLIPNLVLHRKLVAHFKCDSSNWFCKSTKRKEVVWTHDILLLNKIPRMEKSVIFVFTNFFVLKTIFSHRLCLYVCFKLYSSFDCGFHHHLGNFSQSVYSDKLWLCAQVVLGQESWN